MHQLYIRRPFQTIFEIQTDCGQLVDHLKVKYGKYIVYDLTTYCEHNMTIYRRGQIYEIRFNTLVLRTFNPLREISIILDRNTQYDNSMFALHGAAVERNGRAYLLLGSSRAGKSTLTSYLVNSGLGYLTDDCVLIQRKSFLVYPYSTPIKLRKGGYDILARSNKFQGIDEISFDNMLGRYIYSPSTTVDKSIPIARIFFIIRSDTDNQTIYMNTNERVLALMKAPVINYDVTSEYIQFLSNLAKANCCKLVFNDMKYVVEVICNDLQTL